jgi:hypothetical protein
MNVIKQKLLDHDSSGILSYMALENYHENVKQNLKSDDTEFIIKFIHENLLN